MTVQIHYLLDEKDLIVTGTYQPRRNGSVDRFGGPMEPDTPERVEDISATDWEGQEVLLPSYVFIELEQLLIQQAHRDEAARRANPYSGVVW